ncbi:sigma-70 family rna polymerase sigma factor : Antirepressor regulating drug resistance protein OS=Singulisphaera acidiphila (strain ATCC BAA-1392 / DSM 18658 / VKM B-2454 / MOB10) GN=Sinac_0255 PE=4 SV=1: Sigma70_r2: Sigma70_r4_2: CarboxypepD_reg: CarboxypepD_reg: CarboxypepD_reg: CarboxypepD_reg: CarboxypepD_reg: CarboxypepD_reg [Gemmata massiliana]|uniref:ECF RNA polymerase sigma factor SigE n=1 Tax=Gemmata massiliana TaxID=1210884 RepID=A0A6P2D726_9BACT|nr:sigma-70 family RNA polymerase sigma factor [Gemmata massiliana]VTR95944.1 sigma-70 family rna polymerase sigma factor : Antirepressor regulating drug resistance protein OS=Singulisphaera acidiphila (strain ATCC BAA-1392 / DSM 18658 / VKM B-2454 / MOB10) GN=Sinac_0255 PE=4 SV=1: Sigma70_r2: Sigma70_r4_2: CarboxypepD_reg: CarboxypepD_reg: CarboxypepD_reg: CarboxypepD_reg: CarboxypepD_reg: CarboxypepD_reg [Gemmata massiliana]
MTTTFRTVVDVSLRHVPDADLLRRFARAGDDAAFELLVWRYQRLVLGICRRVAGNEHDAEDAFQATFLVLARRAGIVRAESLAGWLARVAYRCSVRARSGHRTQQSLDLSGVPAPEPVTPESDLAALLDAELDRLPDKYRVPVVLCYLLGKTYQQAAAELNCPLGTLSGWVTRGKELLRARLTRRGVALSAGALAANLDMLTPHALASGDGTRFVTAALAAHSSGDRAHSRAAVVANGVLRMMAWKSKVPLVACGVVALVLGLAAASVGLDPPRQPAADPAPVVEKGIRGVVKDSDGAPVAKAFVIAVGANGTGKRLDTTTDTEGRFTFDRFPEGQDPLFATTLVAVKDGFAPVVGHASSAFPNTVTLTLPKATTYTGTVKDRDGKAIAGAEVQFGFVTNHGNFTSWGYTPIKALRGTAVEKAYAVKTDATGAFRFTTVPDGGQLIFRASAPGFAERDTASAAGIHKRDFVAGPNARPANLVLEPEAIVRGRVTSRMPTVSVKKVTVHLTSGQATSDRFMAPDDEGRFEFRGVAAGSYNLFLALPTDSTAAAVGVTVNPKIGETADVNLEVVEGVEVTGSVKVRGGEPVAGATLKAMGSFNPSGHGLPQVTTDKDGRFRFWLPPGEATLATWSTPTGFAFPNISPRKKVTVSAGRGPIVLNEPFEAVRVVKGLSGKVTDATGQPIAHVKVSALQHSSACGNFASGPVTASWDGQFRLESSPNGPLEVGRSVPLRIETSDGQRFEAAALIGKDGAAEIRVPTFPGVDGPTDVKPEELAGVVVDEKGKPLAGVKVHVWDWVDNPENYTFTGADGVFRIKDCGTQQEVQVRFRKDGYSPVMVTRQKVGVKGLVIAMDRTTYFEGVVRGPDGKPVAGARVRADQGPKMIGGGVSTPPWVAPQVWTETIADAQGRYRLYVQPDEYAFHVRVPGVGVARIAKTGIAHGQGRKFDIALEPGITFKARVVDSVSGKPVAGLRLFDWQQKSIDGKSNADGEITIKDMLPGEFTFRVESTSHARWWSEQVIRDWERKTIDDPKTGWQRNFDGLTFDLKPGMAAVTIVAEPVVRVIGRVLDPDGNPVGGATVALARTGSGNSLTGDTRFSVETKTDGTFVMVLPASGAAEYNLVAHDGKYGEWRKWANGVLPPVRTKPGEVIDNVTLRLTRPGTVRGKVVDSKGRPVAGREVRATPTDTRENRYYDPTTTTKADGTFELKFVRPTEQQVQVAPFWLRGADAPTNTSLTVGVKEGQVVEGVSLVAEEEPVK